MGWQGVGFEQFLILGGYRMSIAGISTPPAVLLLDLGLKEEPFESISLKILNDIHFIGSIF